LTVLLAPHHLGGNNG